MTDSSDIRFVAYTKTFLDASFLWLNDPEIRYLTQTPEVTRDGQLIFFNALPGRSDYKIWGVLADGTPVGACGLKHVTRNDAEYWGYIGKTEYWGRGVGKRIVEFCIDEARKLEIKEVYLNVLWNNSRAVRLYEKIGFRRTGENGQLWLMRYTL